MDIKTKDTEVLIIGAGPTGLMMACHLLHYGVKFRIFDKQKDRAHESRAFAIQAKSMEIFQNLGIAEEFLKLARANVDFAFFITSESLCSRKISAVMPPKFVRITRLLLGRDRPASDAHSSLMGFMPASPTMT